MMDREYMAVMAQHAKADEFWREHACRCPRLPYEHIESESCDEFKADEEA